MNAWRISAPWSTGAELLIDANDTNAGAKAAGIADCQRSLIRQGVTGIHIDTGTSSRGWRPAAWVVPLFALAGVVLVPWIVFLVRRLPSTQAAAHWDIAWAGFDAGLALLLLGVATAAWRRSLWLEGVASAAAALLAVDAWFDILTASSRLDLGVAIAEALLVELPLALLCLLLARDAERILRRWRPNAESRGDQRAPPAAGARRAA
jgi:hypothetical protein